MDTNRDLLFGLVAFQKGVIDADRLGEMCAAWNKEAAIPLADRLVNQGWLTVEQKTQTGTRSGRRTESARRRCGSRTGGDR